MYRAAIAVLVLVIGGSYIWLAVQHRALWLGGVAIHEDGRRTFGDTIFYFEHFLREVPVDVVIALFLASAASALFPVGESRSSSIWPALLSAMTLVAGAIAFVTWRDGIGAMVDNLSQSVIRDKPEARGVHWRGHLIPLVWAGCVAACVRAGAIPRSRRVVSRLQWTGWALLVVLTIACGLNWEVVASPRVLGHQARELMTMALVIVPVVVAIASRTSARHALPGFRLSPASLFWALPVFAIPIAVAAGTVLSGGTSEVQLASGWAGAVAGHFFEHTADYVFIGLLTAALLNMDGANR